MSAIIVAMAENRTIGIENTLPWHLSADLKKFREVTTGHTIIMGRKTYDSIGRPLPKRRSIVITRQKGLEIEGCEVVNSIEEALELSRNEKAFIIGGEQIYRQSLSLVDELYITKVQAEVQGDAFFPEFDESSWSLVEEEKFTADEKNDHNFSFQVYKKG